jgi:hypothetical protein
LQRASGAQLVYGELRERILNLDLAPGARLTEAELAAELAELVAEGTATAKSGCAGSHASGSSASASLSSASGATAAAVGTAARGCASRPTGHVTRGAG